LEFYTLIGEIVAGIVYLLMAAKLYRLSRQSRQLLERLLSLTLFSWGLSYRACGAAPLVWMGAEGFSHYARARQRRKLGLCEPLDCNRYLLWGLAGVLWATLEIVVIGQDVVYQRAGAWSASVGLAVCWLEIVPVALIWLVFFPPAGYRRWLNGPAPVQQ